MSLGAPTRLSSFFFGARKLSAREESWGGEEAEWPGEGGAAAEEGAALPRGGPAASAAARAQGLLLLPELLGGGAGTPSLAWPEGRHASRLYPQSRTAIPSALLATDQRSYPGA